MDRRKFLSLFTGTMVATATMADADMLADFMKWLKKGPTGYSFPNPALAAESWTQWPAPPCVIWLHYPYLAEDLSRVPGSDPEDLSSARESVPSAKDIFFGKKVDMELL